MTARRSTKIQTQVPHFSFQNLDSVVVLQVPTRRHYCTVHPDLTFIYIYTSHVPGRFYRKFSFCIDMFLKRNAGMMAIIILMVLRVYFVV